MKLSQLLHNLVASALAVAGILFSVVPAPAIAASKKPNVLLMLTDDLGLDQLQIYGYNSNLPAPPTPNLVALQTAGLMIGPQRVVRFEC